MPSSARRFIQRLVVGPNRREPGPGEGNLWFEGGDGSTREGAIVVRGANYDMEGMFAQFAWVSRHHGEQGVGWSMTSHASGTWRDRHIDTMEIGLADGSSQTLYFDVTESFGRYPTEEWFMLVRLGELLREARADRAALRQQGAPVAERWAAARRMWRVRDAISWVNVCRLGRRTSLRAGLLLFALPFFVVMELLLPAFTQQVGMIEWSDGRLILVGMVVYAAIGAGLGWAMWRYARSSFRRTKRWLDDMEQAGRGTRPIELSAL